MSTRATACLLVLLAAVAAAAPVTCGDGEGVPAGPGGADAAAGTPPHIVLVVIDNLRADHLGAYGYARPTSPNIDRLARAGTLFRNAFAPSSWTKPSIGALFTSRYPSEHRAISFGRQLDAGIPTLAEALQRGGYTTLGFAGNFVHVRPETGMTRGFDHWETINVALEPGDPDEALWTLKAPDGAAAPVRPPLAHEINNPLSKRLLRPVDGPLFIYVHYMEPHASYSPREAWRQKFVRDPRYAEREGFGTTDHIVELARGERAPEPGELERLVDLYDAEVAAADAGVGVLLRRLERRGILQSCVIAVVSDHGEAFGEHDTFFHGGNLHAEQVAVPFVLTDLRRPRAVPAGRVDERAVDLLDVPTTLLALAGVDPPEGMRGRDLLAAAAPPRDVVAELHPDPDFEHHVRDRRQRLVVTRWPRRLVIEREGAMRQYDLAADPGELRPGAVEDALAADARALQGELDEALEQAMQQAPAEIDDHTRAWLRALGYAD